MSMNTVLHPVGPQPARVYWVRRLVLLLLAAVLVTGLALAVGTARGGAADGQGAADGAPAAGAGEGAQGAVPQDAGSEATDGTEDAGDDAEGTEDDAAAACAPETLTTTLAADAPSYPAGATPTFTVTLSNTGDSACTVDAGLTNQALVITSGADRIWSSADCPSEASGERLLLMAPGAAEAMPVAWPRVRSAEGCAGDLPEPRPGTYTAVAVVAGVQSGQVVFELG
jgi:hypothetical protein